MFVLIIFGLVFGAICYYMAENRGRNTTLGFALGFFFGIFAVIGYLIAGKTEEKKAEELQRIFTLAKEMNRGRSSK